MGADAMIAFFGIRFVVESDRELERLETGGDDRLVTSRQAKLHTWLGRITEGSPHCLMIGHRLAVIGVESQQEAVFAESELVQLMAHTRAKLKGAGFDPDTARLYCLLEAQY